RHRAGSRDRRPDGHRPAPALSGGLLDRRRAGRACGLPPCAAVRCPSLHRQHLRPGDLHDLRARRARQHAGRLLRLLHHQPDHRHRRLLFLDRAVLRVRLHLLHRLDVHPAAGAVHAMIISRVLMLIGAAFLLALPAFVPSYFLHLMIQILIWAFIYTAWSLMGRFGFVSFGHGAFMGLGAYIPTLLWTLWGLTPWLGIPVAIAAAVVLAVVVGYPCFARRVVGHYFALVTLALSQVVLLSLVAAREITGGSLGFTQKAVGHSWYALQFPEKGYFYFIAVVLWLAGLVVWGAIDRGIGREALEAISE